MARLSKSEIAKEKQEILSHLKNDVKKANLRLSMLEKYYGKDSWASSILRDRLGSKKIQALSLGGRIKIDENMNLLQLRAVDTATKNFLASKTSTMSGIRKIRKETIATYRKKFADIDGEKINKLSLEDAEKLYSIFEDKNMRDFAEKVGSSNLVTLVSDNMKKSDVSNRAFYKDIYSNLIDKNSVDNKTKTTMRNIYNKIIK